MVQLWSVLTADNPDGRRAQAIEIRVSINLISCGVHLRPLLGYRIAETNMLVVVNVAARRPAPSEPDAAPLRLSPRKRPQCYLLKPFFSCTVSLCREAGELLRAFFTGPKQIHECTSRRQAYGRQAPMGTNPFVRPFV